MKTSMHNTLALLALAPLIGSSACAAEAPSIPGAGTLLQQTEPIKQPTPSASGAKLHIEQGNGAALPPSAPFAVKAIQITGNTLFVTSLLHTLVVDAEGKDLTLEQLSKAVDRITAYYHQHGYLLAEAFLPTQTIRNGVVQVQVIEARYGQIRLDNHSRVKNSLLQSTLSSLQGGQQIEQTALEHSLLLLSDIPGAITVATLKPGEAVGTSDLQVAATTTQPITGSAALDDYGNRYTGRERIGGTLNAIDPLHQGDVLSVNLLSSGSDMDYARLNYEAQLGGSGLGLGTRVGGAYSALHYTLGDTLAALGGHGTAQISSLWLKHTLLRNDDLNLYSQLQYDRKQLNDDIDTSSIQTVRHLDNWTASLAGDWRDMLFSGGVCAWSVGWTAGRLGFDNAQAQLADAASAKTLGRFSKWTVNFNRLQRMSQNNTLFVALAGQGANANLDTSEKMAAGGTYTVRAYDMGALSGDGAALLNLELRHELGRVWSGQTQAIAFIDSEHVTVDHAAWAPGPNDATLSGAGVGLNWFGPESWSAKATVARQIGATPTLVGANQSVRAWVEIDKAL